MRVLSPSSVALVLAFALIFGSAGAAWAHTSERAYVLLLPTDLYIFGGALVVALSFAVMAVIPSSGLMTLERARVRLGSLPDWTSSTPALLTLLFIVGLIVAGYTGSPDPLLNPLPVVVWGIWWVGFTFATALFGNLWDWLNPWRPLYSIVTAVPGLRVWRERPPLRYPAKLAYWPAVVLLFAFAWFELIYPAPQDPTVLADAVTVYMLITLAGMLWFGGETWLKYGECFTLFFRIVSMLSPFDPRRSGIEERRSLGATLPGIRLVKVEALPVSGVTFVLLALSAVSFDGFSRTFWWLGTIGVNPLEYPGRTMLMTANTAGFIGLFLTLMAVFVIAVLAGRRLSRINWTTEESLGRFVASIVPIAFGYHFAHYLPEFMIDIQFALRALSDPYQLGWDLLGLRDYEVNAAFLGNHVLVQLVWKLQVAAIVLAHVVAVGVSHLLAIGQLESLGQAVLSQAPMTALMIAYTLFGLWLLATPVVG